MTFYQKLPSRGMLFLTSAIVAFCSSFPIGMGMSLNDAFLFGYGFFGLAFAGVLVYLGLQREVLQAQSSAAVQILTAPGLIKVFHGEALVEIRGAEAISVASGGLHFEQAGLQRMLTWDEIAEIYVTGSHLMPGGSGFEEFVLVTAGGEKLSLPGYLPGHREICQHIIEAMIPRKLAQYQAIMSSEGAVSMGPVKATELELEAWGRTFHWFEIEGFSLIPGPMNRPVFTVIPHDKTTINAAAHPFGHSYPVSALPNFEAMHSLLIACLKRFG